MATKRPVDNILSDTIPEKSKNEYLHQWKLFVEFVGHDDKPTETDFVQYVDYLHTQKKLAASTIWKVYSILNHMYQHHFAIKLQTFPKLTQLLKTYNASYERKVASVFSKENIETFLQMKELDGDHFWLLRKAVLTVAVSGGLRCAEITELVFDDFTERDGTYHFNIKRKKQQGEQLSSKFIIPTKLAVYFNNYIVAMRTNVGEYMLEGRLFKGTPKYNHADKAKFVNQPMGRNKLAMIGVDIAKMLQLPHPETYTGHCFRRTSATLAADGGATTAEMQRHYGWKSAKTAMKYVDNSDAGATAMASVLGKIDEAPGTSSYFTARDESAAAEVALCAQPAGTAKIHKTVTVSTVSENKEVKQESKSYIINCAGDNAVYNFY